EGLLQCSQCLMCATLGGTQNPILQLTPPRPQRKPHQISSPTQANNRGLIACSNVRGGCDLDLSSIGTRAHITSDRNLLLQKLRNQGLLALPRCPSRPYPI